MQSDVYAWSWSSLNKSGAVNRPMALASPIQTKSFIMKIAVLYAQVSTTNQQYVTHVLVMFVYRL
jgi:hypothetical protein